ncbi:protein translocase subunit SecD [Aliiruegeria sabulilitoris]|uniref:protein translocase subunit SecD n=1 Tax=Aliiruegeria sabulilitoris TaxID=1510458 RepID=UPI00083010C4|nr:protein translocase subunit SecD [Aliiruegeria sabulilitoris]NDR55122.1 protein translocase subunit SecD [Pseudoruegeria sp. M32A2M]
MLQFSTWKRVLIWAFTALVLFMAVPNLFYPRVESHNDALKQIEAAGSTPELQEAVSAWPSWMPSGLVNLGLDLRGGAYLLADVQVEDVYAERMNGYWPEVRDALREKRDTVGAIRRVDGPVSELHVKIANPEAMAEAIETAKSISRPILSLTGVGSNDIEVTGQGDTLIVTLSEHERIATDDRTVKQSLEIVRRRVDEAGTREPSIQRQGETRIIIQVPGIGSAQELKDLIGQTAKLTFHPVVSRTSDPEANAGARNLVVPSMDEEGTYYIIEESFVVSGDELTDAQPSFDQNGRPAVSFRFNPTGARKFGDYTRDNIGSPFAIVLDNEVISAPTIQDHIPGGSGIITGNFTIEESTNLAVLLRAGALPAEMTFLQERTIGPELGADSIEAGRIATIVAFVAVLAFMWLSYGLFGIFANIALIINVGLIFGLLSIIGATLTLPGIAGIVLTVGMAVDANVLVFERIREELKTARGPSRAIELGYEKALSAILDANVTTFITAAILFALGSGPVRGFAITLGLGILTSVFTAIYITRLLIVMWFERRRPKTIEV